jgi:hypothetical protein
MTIGCRTGSQPRWFAGAAILLFANHINNLGGSSRGCSRAWSVVPPRIGRYRPRGWPSTRAHTSCCGIAKGGRMAVVTNLEDLPPQSCGGHWRDELRGCAGSRLQAMHFTSVPLMDAWTLGRLDAYLDPGSLINADQIPARLQIFPVNSAKIPSSLRSMFNQKGSKRGACRCLKWDFHAEILRNSLLIRC